MCAYPCSEADCLGRKLTCNIAINKQILLKKYVFKIEFKPNKYLQEINSVLK